MICLWARCVRVPSICLDNVPPTQRPLVSTGRTGWAFATRTAEDDEVRPRRRPPLARHVAMVLIGPRLLQIMVLPVAKSRAMRVS